MNKFILMTALAAGSAALSSPASAWQFCVDKDSTMYGFLDQGSRQIQSAHGPEAEGLVRRVEAAAAEDILKAAAANRFHVPTCPTALERAIASMPALTAEEIDRYRKGQ